MNLFIAGILVYSFNERTKCCFTQFSALSVPTKNRNRLEKMELKICDTFY